MEIIHNVHLVDGVKCNCYLFADEQLTLIDTGLPGQTGKILRYITNTLRRQPSELKTIILTHCDIDHTGSAKELRELTGAKIAVHRIEADYIGGRKLRLGPDPRRWDIDAVYKGIAGFMSHIKVQPFEADILVDDGDTVAGLNVVGAPGHTAGSMALYEPVRHILFSGDAMIYTGKKVHGSPDRVTMEPTAACQSYLKLVAIDFDILLGGHGKPLMPNASAKVRILSRKELL